MLILFLTLRETKRICISVRFLIHSLEDLTPWWDCWKKLAKRRRDKAIARAINACLDSKTDCQLDFMGQNEVISLKVCIKN